MGTLIILRGNSGSGKTTVAKALQERFGENTLLISQDMVRREMLRVRDGADTKALPLLEALLRYGHGHSAVVILEGILRAEWYGPLFELAVRLYGGSMYAYYFDLPFEETVRRHGTKPNCRDFGPEDMRAWWREKDFSDVLHETVIPPEKDAERVVEEIYSAVRLERRRV